MRRALLMLPLVAAGCRTPDAETVSAPLTPPAAWSQAADGTAAAVSPWIESFGDPQLTELVAAGLAHNYDLQAAAARVQAAAAAARIARADRYPVAEAGGDASRGRRNGVTSASYGLDLAVGWELDLWGRLRDGAAAGQADFRAAEADLAAARLSLAARIAAAWFELAGTTEETLLSEQTLASFQKSQAVIEDRFRDGITTALDVRLGRASVASARSQLAADQSAQDAAGRQLEVLLGRYPAASLAGRTTLPRLPPPAPVGLPAALLERRPDLAAARERLTATRGRVKAAAKAQLPAIRLTGSAGTSSEQLRDLLRGDSLLWNLAAGLTQPIFNAGELAARVDVQQALREVSFAAYAQAALKAFEEVETALAAETYLRLQLAAQQLAVDESREAEAIAMAQYQSGLIEITTLLLAQRRVFDARAARIRTHARQLQNRINLHLALGGDF